MKKQHDTTSKAILFYAFLLEFYPQGYKKAFGSQKLQTFKDYYRDVIQTEGSTGLGFWVEVMTDETKSIFVEQALSFRVFSGRNTAWKKSGLICGSMLGLFHVTHSVINNLTNPNLTLNTILNNSLPLSVLLFCGIAGFYSARKSGTVKSGIYAGLLTAGMSLTIGMIALFLITFLFMDTISHNTFMIMDFHRSGLQSIDQFIIDDALGAAAVATAFSFICGGVVATLGAYIGKNARKAK